MKSRRMFSGRELRSGASAVAGMFVSLMTVAGARADYTFVKIADTAGPYSDFFGYPAVNNAGVVAFHAVLDAGGTGIFKSDGTNGATIATSPGVYSQINAAPDINASGEVVFRASKLAGGTGIFKGSGGGVVTVAQSDATYADFGERPSINDAGTVAVTYRDNFANQGVLVDGNQLFKSQEGFYFVFTEASINNNGVVCFTATGAGSVQYLVKGAGGGAGTQIANSSGDLLTYGNPPYLNDSGVVSFKGFLDAGGSTVYTGDGGALDPIATLTPPFTNFTSTGIDISNNGTVVFWASVSGPSGQGFFTGPDAVKDKVIRTGDALFGSTVSNLQSTARINDFGDVAFTYALANGSKGVALAVAPRAPIPGDINGDGQVNGFDITLILAAWGTSDPDADVNGDGTVNGLDITIVLANWTD